MEKEKSINYFEKTFKIFDEFKNGQILCDVKLRGKANGYIIHAHKIVLAANSLFFKAMFSSGMKECVEDFVTLESIESNILEKVVDYLYTGDIKLLPTEIEQILDASHMLGIENIHEKCFIFLRNNIDITNCHGIAHLAEKYSYKEISKIAESYAFKNFRSVANTEEFLNLPYENVSALVSSNELNILCEAEVYEAILTWVKHDTEKRKERLHSLLSNVRFPMLTRKFLIDRVTREELILNDVDCREYLYNALDYHLIPERRSLKDSCAYSPRVALTSALYVIGGENRTGPLNSVEMFELSSQTWQRCASLQTSRKHLSVTLLNGIIYCIGGIDNYGADLSTVEKYDPSLNCWTSVPPMHKCKGAVASISLDGWLYVAGGSNEGSSIKFVERYDPVTEEWSSVQPMKNSRSYFAMGVLNNKIYAIGGYCALGETERCEIFDPLINKWQELADLNKTRMNHGVATTFDKIFAIGGQNSCGVLDCIEKYNKGLNMWLIIKHTLNPRAGASVNLVTSKSNSDWLYIVGGIDGTLCYHSSVKTINWQSVDYFIGSGKSMNEPRAFAGSCVL